MNDDLGRDLVTLARRDAAEVSWDRWMTRLDRRLRPPAWKPLVAAAAAVVIAAVGAILWRPSGPLAPSTAEAPRRIVFDELWTNGDLRPYADRFASRLAALARGGDPAARARAIDALARGSRGTVARLDALPDAETLPALLAAGTAAARANVSQRIRDPRRREAVLAALAENSPADWVEAVLDAWPALLPRGDSSALAYLRRHQDRAVRSLWRRLGGRATEATAWYVSLAGEIAAPELAGAAGRYLAVPSLRDAAIDALARIPGPEATELLAAAARDRGLGTRGLDALAARGDREALAAVLGVALAGTPVGSERLARFPREWTVPCLIRAMRRTEWRREANLLLRELTGRRFPADPSLWQRWWNTHFSEAT